MNKSELIDAIAEKGGVSKSDAGYSAFIRFYFSVKIAPK